MRMMWLFAVTQYEMLLLVSDWLTTPEICHVEPWKILQQQSSGFSRVAETI